MSYYILLPVGLAVLVYGLILRREPGSTPRLVGLLAFAVIVVLALVPLIAIKSLFLFL